MELPEKLTKPYNPKDTEDRIYKLWEESGFFNPDVCVEKGVTAPDAKPFTIIMPPPNVTGVLHMGHAMMLTIEDIMIRYKRMQGFRTLWLPGTDHAAIATQSKVEKDILKKENKSRHDLGREELLRRIGQFAQESHDTIASQVRVMGSSCDWSREAFTLDEPRNRAVKTMFKKMYDDGLIYRGNRIVNWDPKGQTTIADDEIVYEERKAKLYTFKYSKDFPIAISTTRPETKVGDVAVAVNPDDARYKEFVGKTYTVENFCGVKLEIKIVADPAVEKEFGTGALGVTPAHSQIDWEIADRHDLPHPQVINEYAKMSVGDERLLGKKVAEAREVIVEWLKTEGLLEKEEEVTQNVATAERTGGIVEPLPKLQWFVAVNKEFTLPHSEIDGIASGAKTTLKEIMRKAVEGGQVNIIPDYFNKTYFHWIDNLRDWCISRQIWYGHRVPVWYGKDEGEKRREQREEFLPKNITVYLARHGETEFNISKIFKSQEVADTTPLTEKGIADAKSLGKSLKGKKITKVVRSTLLRTKQTTEILMKELGRDVSEVEIWEELKEIRIGENDGKEKPIDYNPLKFSVENNIQTLDEVEAQGRKIIEKIGELEDGEHVLIVGHGAINSVVMALNACVPKEAFVEYKRKQGPTKNGSFYEIHFLVSPKEENLIQDEDTLDTWFSSALWTFSTLGWPDKTKDLEVYHPTDVLETGYEILFFWVARMVLMSGYALGQVPFHTVYLHGTVRDAQGRKMSKSLGNGIDPIEIAQKFGADAGRMALIVGTTPGTDSKISEDKIKAYSKFSNKMWNATRFVLDNTKDLDLSQKPELDAEDQASLDELHALITEITKEMDDYKYYIVSEKLYHHFWHVFADVIIERSKKKILENTNPLSAKWILRLELDTLITALHPFMPFVTEELWSLIHPGETMLMVNGWPKYE